MPGARRAKRGASRLNSEQKPSAPAAGKPDEYDGRANLQAGDKGKEPGGRWSPAYYESGPKIISRDTVRDA